MTALLPLAAGAETGAVEGRMVLAVEGASLSSLGPAAVYLEPVGSAPPHTLLKKSPRIRQRNATFEPDFMVVAAGQSVVLSNDDEILHNVFSYSKPNDFDLGLYPAGESRTVILKETGIVRLYCSIHDSMRAVIVVAPNTWHARVQLDGSFRISGVPPGSYRIISFNEPLPSFSQALDVKAGQTTSVELIIQAGPR